MTKEKYKTRKFSVGAVKNSKAGHHLAVIPNASQRCTLALSDWRLKLASERSSEGVQHVHFLKGNY